jgi:acetyl esterase
MSTLDPDLAVLLSRVAAAGLPPASQVPVADLRARVLAGDAQMRQGPEMAAVDDVVLEASGHRVDARLYRHMTRRHGCVVYVHGGGWVTGGPTYGDELCRTLAAVSGREVLAVDYRLAPEHPFPAALDDVEAAVRWAAASYGTSEVTLVGDSAGGNLAAGVALRLRDRSGPLPAAMGLLYPVLDSGLAQRSYRHFGEGYLLTTEDMRWFWSQYVPDTAERQAPTAAPLRADSLAGMPRTLVVTAGFDPLQDEATAFHERLLGDGVASELLHVPDMVHGFLRFTGISAGAARAADALVVRLVELASSAAVA